MKTHIQEPGGKNPLCGRPDPGAVAIRFPETERELESKRYGLDYCAKCESAWRKHMRGGK